MRNDVAAFLENSTADQVTVSHIKPVLRLSGDPTVVIDFRYIYTLKVSQLKDILQALRELHGPNPLYSTSGNKDVLLLRVLAALYPQHASSIMRDHAPAVNSQPAFRHPSTLQGQAPPAPGCAPPSHYPAAVPPFIPSALGNVNFQPNRVQVHLRAPINTASSPQYVARTPIVPQSPATSSSLKDAASRWSHPMFERLAVETFNFTHPITSFQATSPFDKPQPMESDTRVSIVPYIRRAGSASGYFPFQLQPGPSVVVSWNGCPVEIPKIVNVKSKLASATIHYHPMVLPRNYPCKVGPVQLVMTGGGAENVCGFALMLVRPRRLDELEALVRSHPMSKITKRPEFNHDDDCAATSTPVQLKDPLSFCRIQIPVKTVKCKHLQCFDLSTFIQYCERSGIWYCPCCPSKPGLSINDVYVDQFFLNMITGASAHDTNTVYLKHDGSWTTVDPDLAPPAPPPSSAPLHPLISHAQPLVQRIRVFHSSVPGGDSWLFELPVGSTVRSLKLAIEAQYQIPHELFVLHWLKQKTCDPDPLVQGPGNCSTSSCTPLLEIHEQPARDDDPVLVFGEGQVAQESSLRREARYSIKWLIDRKHAPAFLNFRLSSAKSDELYSILHLLVDDLDTHDKGAWLCSPQARLDECDLKLLAAFAPSSLQDMQVLLPLKGPVFWNSYHQIFLKSISDYLQLGRRAAVSSAQVHVVAPDADKDEFVAGTCAARFINQSDMHGHSSVAQQAPSGSGSRPSLRLSQVIGQQDATHRLRAAAEWSDTCADTLCCGDSPMVSSETATGTRGRSFCLSEDDLPLVQSPQHFSVQDLPRLIDRGPAAALGHPPPVSSRLEIGQFSSQTPRSSFHNMHRAPLESLRQPTIGQKRPAPDSVGSSASNAIVIDDD